MLVEHLEVLLDRLNRRARRAGRTVKPGADRAANAQRHGIDRNCLGPERETAVAARNRQLEIEPRPERECIERTGLTRTGAPAAPEIVNAVARTERGLAARSATLPAPAQTRVQVLQGLSTVGIAPITVAALAALDDREGRTVAGRAARRSQT